MGEEGEVSLPPPHTSESPPYPFLDREVKYAVVSALCSQAAIRIYTGGPSSYRFTSRVDTHHSGIRDMSVPASDLSDLIKRDGLGPLLRMCLISVNYARLSTIVWTSIFNFLLALDNLKWIEWKTVKIIEIYDTKKNQRRSGTKTQPYRSATINANQRQQITFFPPLRFFSRTPWFLFADP